MFENIMLSFRGIRSHKMRSVLTMLGIIIGIAAIIIIVSIINGAGQQLKDEMVGDSTNTVKINLYTYDDPYLSYDASEAGSITGISKIPSDVVQKLLDVDGVDAATALYSHEYSSTEVKYLDKSCYGNTYGVELDYFPLSGLTLTSGRLFIERDYEQKNNVIILSDSTAGQLFKNDEPIGKTVQLGHELFTVVGVVTKIVDYTEIENLSDYYLSFGFEDKSCYVPASSWNDVIGYDDIQGVLIKINDPDLIVTASQAAADILNANLPMSSKYEFKAGALSEDAEYLKNIMNITSILLIGIASISLLVGGIGVMNIMLVSVTERTREIGLKKALGAKKRVILGQFLTESVVLTSVGGLIGVLIGIGMSYLVGMIVSLPIEISTGAILISVGFSMGVGIIFGLVPSVKAANLDPIDALRYE